MGTAEADDFGFSASGALARTAGFAAAGAVIAGAHVLFGIALPCPLLTWTGVQCPFCGATRAAAALAGLDLGQAWSHNALLVVGIGLLAVCSMAWLVEVLGGPALRPPQRLRPVTQRKLYWVGGVVAIAFMVVRNLV